MQIQIIKSFFARVKCWVVEYIWLLFGANTQTHTHPLKNTLHKRNGYKLLFDFWLSSMYISYYVSLPLSHIFCSRSHPHSAQSSPVFSFPVHSLSLSHLTRLSFVFLIIEIKFDCLINVPSGYNIHMSYAGCSRANSKRIDDVRWRRIYPVVTMLYVCTFLSLDHYEMYVMIMITTWLLFFSFFLSLSKRLKFHLSAENIIPSGVYTHIREFFSFFHYYALCKKPFVSVLMISFLNFIDLLLSIERRTCGRNGK